VTKWRKAKPVVHLKGGSCAWEPQTDVVEDVNCVMCRPRKEDDEDATDRAERLEDARAEFWEDC
jgi:hypothetical protein